MNSRFQEACDIIFKLLNTVINKFIDSFIEEEKQTRMCLPTINGTQPLKSLSLLHKCPALKADDHRSIQKKWEGPENGFSHWSRNVQVPSRTSSGREQGNEENISCRNVIPRAADQFSRPSRQLKQNTKGFNTEIRMRRSENSVMDICIGNCKNTGNRPVPSFITGQTVIRFNCFVETEKPIKSTIRDIWISVFLKTYRSCPPGIWTCDRERQAHDGRIGKPPALSLISCLLWTVFSPMSLLNFANKANAYNAHTGPVLLR